MLTEIIIALSENFMQVDDIIRKNDLSCRSSHFFLFNLVVYYMA